MVQTLDRNSGFERDPVPEGGGTDYFSDVGHDDHARFWRKGESFPRIAIVASTGQILVGNGLAYPTADIVVGPSGITAADVSFEPTGTIEATNVQAAIEEAVAEAGTGGPGSGLPVGGTLHQFPWKLSSDDGDVGWVTLVASLIGAATQGDMDAVNAALTAAVASLETEIDAIVTGGGVGDMLLSDALFGIDPVAAGENLGLRTGAYADIGNGSTQVAPGDQASLLIAAIPLFDVDMTAVPDDPDLIADAHTADGITTFRGGRIASKADAAAGLVVEATVADDDALAAWPADARTVVQTGTMTADKTIPLPAASSVDAGVTIWIADESGSPNFATHLELTWEAFAGDTIANDLDILNTTTIVMRGAFASCALRSNGVDTWFVTERSAQKPLLYWQHPRRIATPGDGTPTPIPWNATIVDPFGFTPGLDALTCTVAAGSDAAVLPQGTIHCDTAGGVSLATLGFPAAGYITVTGPPKLVTGIATNVTANTFGKAAHGFVLHDRIKLSGLSGTTGLSVLTEYFVTNEAASTFQLATSFANATAGTAIDLTGTNDTGLVAWTNNTDTVVGYTALGGTGGKDFLNCNTAGANRRSGISTGTLKTGMVICGANVEFYCATPYLYALTACVEFEANAYGTRNLWLTDAQQKVFVVTKGNDAIATDALQMVSVTSQPGVAEGQYSLIEAVNTSGEVVNVAVDAIASPLLMMAHLTAA